MNHIKNLEAQIIAKDAELQAMRDGMNNMWAYLTSEKFASDNYVNTNDVLLRIRETLQSANYASDAAYMNELGPKAVAGWNGWECPVCASTLNNHAMDTEAKTAQRMHDHWIANHRKEAN